MRTDRARAKQIIATYAQVLLDAAFGENAVIEVGAELEQAAATMRGHADLRTAMLDDSVPAEARRAIVTGVFSDLRPIVTTTLGVMAEEGNIDLLSSVAEAYEAAAERRLNVTVVDVTTVVPLTDALRESIKNKLAGDFDTGIVLREHVDPSILGGIIMSAHGRRIDASIVSQLERTRMALTSTHTGGEA